MATIRPMRQSDLLRISSTNLDHLTETYNIAFYIEYLTKWPELCQVIEGMDGQIEGYSTFSPAPRPLVRVWLCTTPHATSLTRAPTVLGKLESSPYPPPLAPYHPATTGVEYPNYLPWHGHITALTVAPSARRLGHATALSSALARSSDAADAWFVDLFVRASNEIAKELYRKMGYSVYRCVKEYYNDGEDALDMRMPCSRDKDRGTVREGGEKVEVTAEDVW
jgi:N-terminal acetyltransferase B complex catalytic subunit